MTFITPHELNNWRQSGHIHRLIDIRESYEIETCSIGGTPIPMGEIVIHAQEIPRDIPVVIHCKSGKRSAAVIEMLERKFEFSNLYSLEGGILNWIKEIDNSLTVY